MTTPTPSALSATGQQLQESQKTQACPKAKPNRRLHRSTDPRRAEGHCTGARPSGLFFWTVHCAAVGGFAALRMRRTPCGGGPLSFRARPIRGPAAPRAVGRGGASKPTEWARKCPWGARERAQFSPQAETELSGLCDDMGAHPRWTSPPAGARPPWPPFDGPNFPGWLVTSPTLRRIPPSRHCKNDDLPL